MISKTLGTSAVFALLLGAATTMAATQRYEYRESTLDNGLRVLTIEDHHSPLVDAQVWYHVGSKDEDPARQGFAHMFEHMMFRGTDRIGPQDHFKYLSRYGARVNGYTYFDMTVYWETLPASQLDRALWLEAERLGHLKINDDYFAAEREVVKEERRTNYLMRPYGLMRETLYGTAFKVHPYRWTPIGNMPHLDAATSTELQAFFNRYYVPNNATLVVVGDITHEQVLAKARKYFGPIPRRPDPPRVAVKEPPMSAPARVEMMDDVPAPMVVLAYRAPAAVDPDSVAADMLVRILARGQSSRLYRHLVQGKQIAVNISADDDSLEHGGLFTLNVTLKPGVAIETGEEALLSEVHELLAKGISAEELEKARNQAVAAFIRTSQTAQGRADQLGFAAVIQGDPERVNTDLERKRTITAEEIMAAAKRIFRDDSRVVLIVRPGKKPEIAEAAQDKSARAETKVPDLPMPKELPSGEQPKPVDLPQPSLKRLANGLQLAVFEDHTAPAVSISFNQLIGARNDPSDQAGLAYVTTNTMRRGTRGHTGDELAERIDRLGMSLSDNCYSYENEFAIWTLSEHLDAAGETLAEILREPVFPENEVTNFIARAIAREEIKEKNPSIVASRAFAGAVYGQHFLARPSTGTAESLKRITRDAVVVFHHDFFGPAGATLVFAGDVTPERAVSLAERLFGDWQSQPQPAVAPQPPASTATRILIIDRPGAVQSEIRIGQVAPVSRKDADYPGAKLVSQLFGESFSSRINRKLRIEEGLTYGARGYFDVQPDVGTLLVSTFTRTERTAQAVRSGLAEIERLRSVTITRDEVDEARDMVIGGFQMGLETVGQIAGRWWDLVVYGLPQNWYGAYLQGVAGVSDPAALDKVAKAKLDPARLTIVVVGDAATLRPELQKIAPVEVTAGPTTAPAATQPSMQ